LSQPPPALAALAAPQNLSPSGVAQSGSPVLQWNRVGKAVKYEVQLATDPGFSAATIKYQATTTNRRVTPTANLPQQELFWRVRSVNASNVKSNWADTSFAMSEIAGPALVSPADDPSGSSPLQQPDEPVLLTWEPVRNATGYTIEIDDNDDFVGTKSFTSKSSTYLFTTADPAVAVYSWHVRAVFSGSFNSTWSDTSHFTVGALPAPVLTAPADSPSTQVKDAVLDWEPVPGAVKYEVQVDTNDQFVTPLTDSATVVSTWYARPTTLDNDQYWWRVRALDANSHPSPWAASLNQFQRRWPEQPTQVYPADSDLVGGPFYYEWDPIPNASSYRLEVSEDPSFTPGNFDVCITYNTTYTPESADSGCMPTPGNVTYWRVRGVDNPAGVLGLYSEIHQFTYSPAIVTQQYPADGATVDVPTMRWAEYPQAVKYIVTLKRANGATVDSATTFSTSWTPTVGARLDPAIGPFHWTVQAVRQDGEKTQIKTFDASPTFNLSGDVPDTGVANLAPQSPANGAHSVRFPELRWEPAFDTDSNPAKSYRVQISQVGSTSVATLPDTYVYNSGTDTRDTYLVPGVYQWYVQATFLDGSTANGPSRTFQIDNLTKVTGQRVSLTGSGFNDPSTTCSRSLNNAVPTTNEICGNLQQTPVFRWDPKPDAGYYIVYVYNDRDMTNATTLGAAGEIVSGTTWTPPSTMLRDSQAGTAYYWYVRPCKSPSRCAPDPLGTADVATNAFDKRSNPISGLQVRLHDNDAVLTDDVPQFADEVVFSWDDYLDTNQDGNALDVTGLPSTVEAKSYRVQVSTSPTFPTGSATFTSPNIDQTSYSVSSKTLPEGSLYWRVQAIDADDNTLAWSLNKDLTGNAREIKKVSPAPTLLGPDVNEKTSGNPTFSWEPLNYAKSYTVEVYKNNDVTLSSANRVVNASTTLPSYAVFDKVLPQSSSPYLWRVRRVDASGLAGAWSELRSFRVAGDPPTQTAPSADSYVAGNDLFFTWLPVDGAASYKLEIRRKGETSVASATTVGLAYAPISTYSNGNWEWRVSGLDASSQSLGASPWRGFKVDSIAPTVVKMTPKGKVARTTNFIATFSEPVKHVDTTTMQIFVKGQQHNLSAAVTMSNGNKTATLNPAANLQSGKVYTIKLTGQITDRGGNALAPTSWKATAK
jgi:hypothetical protein